MEVTDKGAAIEYDCARGSIDHQLVTEAGGRFKAKGTHASRRGGPGREDEHEEREKGAPALYSGRTDGKTMTLTVRLAGSDEEVGTFTLTHGGQARLTKCK